MRSGWRRPALVLALLALILACPTGSDAAPGERLPAEIRVDERVSPQVDCNPIRTQHTIVVTVTDACGNPLPGQRVEWILADYPEAVGDIVGVDDQYLTTPIAPVRGSAPTNAGNKITNKYAVSVTNYQTEMLDSGNNHPYVDRRGERLPDIAIGPGQTWLTITSTREGVTDIVILVPAIRDGTKHKIFAKKIWADYDVAFPQDAVNVLPETEHELPVRVFRTDGSGIPGQVVEAEILDGPQAVFDETNDRIARFESDADGNVNFLLRNTQGEAGTNRIRFTAFGRFYGETCPRTVIVNKAWQHVSLEVACIYPGCQPIAFAGKPFEKMVSVRNTGDATAENVVLLDEPAPGLVFADRNPFPAQIGTLKPGETRTGRIRMVAAEAGTYMNRVTATSTTGDARVENECGIEVVAGVLEIEKICQPTRVNVGEDVTFSVLVTNAGRGPLENVQVRDAFPAGIEARSQNRVDLGTLGPGESQEVQFLGRATEPGLHTNRAYATAEGALEREATCTVEVGLCRLEILLNGPAQVYYNEAANFQITVRNVGDGDAPDCAVRVTAGECLGSVVRDFNVGPLPPGQSWTQEFPLRGTGVGSCVLTADTVCGSSCQSREELPLRVTGLPAIETDMVDLGLDGSREGVFRVGETFIYRLTISEDLGTEPTPDLFVTMGLPPELEFVSARSDRGATMSAVQGRVRSTEFRLDLREMITFDIQVRVLAVPQSGFVVAPTVIRRASDGMELSRETENTSIRE